MSPRPVVMRDVIVVGGGCYGVFYAAQLEKAKRRDKARYRQVLVVDRNPRCRVASELGAAPDREIVVSDWAAFFDRRLGSAQPAEEAGDRDVIVPSPHMPHLMFEWVVRRTRARFPDREIAVTPVPGTLGTPYDRRAADGTRYVSFADWVCPTHCIEPARCPAIDQARTWEMPDAVRALAARMRQEGRRLLGPALFVCRHTVMGVGTFAVDEVLNGAQLVEAAARQEDGAAVLVGTVSSCHGALNLVAVRPARLPRDHEGP